MPASIKAYVDWYCPACKKTERLLDKAKPHTRMHVCPKTWFMSVPMVRAGTSAKIEANLREDYIGTEKVQLLGERGLPIMNITVTRDNGTDMRVFAPMASAGMDA